MVLASHIIFGAYGFWLPNDPRGSWSDFVCSWELFRYGPATKTASRQSLAKYEHDHQLRLAAKQALKYPAVEFTGLQARAVATGFKTYAEKSGLIIHACAILPEHVHMVVARHRLNVESIVVQLKGWATRELLAQNIHPLIEFMAPGGKRPPKCFARGEWKVFLDSEDDIRRAIKYVEDNPLKENKPRQIWSFTRPYRG